jgi:co-chaperonin GroES (HSP10)
MAKIEKKATKERLQPLGVHVLIEPIDPGEENKYVHGKSQTQPEKGKVVEVGEACESEALKAAKGKIVVYRKYSPEEYTLNGKKLFLLEESDIMGIWHK